MYESIITALTRIKNKVLAEYENKGLRASGNFSRSISIGRQGRYKVVLTLPFYSRYITKFKGNTVGRGPGKFPPLDAIQQWVKDKGLAPRDWATGRFIQRSDKNYRKLAFLVGRKIAEQGTDIYNKRRQPIDLDRIVEGELDYLGEEIADRIIEDIDKRL